MHAKELQARSSVTARKGDSKTHYMRVELPVKRNIWKAKD